MSEKPRRARAETKFNEIIAEFRPLARRTLVAIAVSRFVLALIPLQLKFLLDPLVRFEPIELWGFMVQPNAILAILVCMGLLIASVRGIADYVVVATSGRHGHGLVAQLRVAMFEHILRIPCSFAIRRGTGKILLRFIGDSDALRSWYSHRKPAVIVDRWLVGMLLAVMLMVDWRLTLVVLIPVPLILYVARWLAPIIADETLNARFQQAKLSGEIGYRFDAIQQAKWLDRNRDNREVIRERAENVAALNAHRDLRAALLQGLGQFFAFSSVPLLLMACVLLAWRDQISLGQSIAFVWLTAHMAVAIHRLNAAIVVKEKAMVSRQRILKLLERTAEPGRSSDLQSLDSPVGSLEFEDVRFDDKHQVETPVSMAFNGFGLHKVDDRLLRPIISSVSGFEKINSGRILVAGHDLSTLNIESVRQRIGWVMDQPMILPGTIRENLMLADPDLGASELEEFCRSIDDELDAEWLDRETGLHGQKLTPREVITIALIRALVNGPSLIFVDLQRIRPDMAVDLYELIERASHSAVVLIPGHIYGEFESEALSLQAEEIVP